MALDYESVYSLYSVERLSSTEIATKFDVSPQAVCQFIKRHNILALEPLPPVCRVCGKLLNDINWSESAQKYGSRRCIDCSKDYLRDYYLKHDSTIRARSMLHYRNHPDVNKKARKKYNKGLRLELIKRLGGKCFYCGETRLAFLTAGHKNNDGATHRQELFGRREGNLAFVLARDNYPLEDMARLQVECWNCNAGAKRRKWWREDSSELTAQKKYNKKTLVECFRILGGKCICCGDGDLTHFTLGHKNNDGAQHKNKSGSRVSDIEIAKAIIKGNYNGPEIQLECFNCNMGKNSNNGVCPHTEIQSP